MQINFKQNKDRKRGRDAFRQIDGYIGIFDIQEDRNIGRYIYRTIDKQKDKQR